MGVRSGHYMGAVIRSIGDQPGPRTVTHEAHIAIEGHDAGVRIADIQIGDAQTLRDLAADAAFLADELAGAQAPPDRDRCRYRPPSSGVSATEEGCRTTSAATRGSATTRDTPPSWRFAGVVTSFES